MHYRVLGRTGGEDVGVAGVDRRNACLAQRPVADPRVAVLFHDHRDVARRHLLAVEGGIRIQQKSDIRREILGDMGA